MAKKKHTADELFDFIMEETTCEITCTNCGKSEGNYGDAMYEQDRFFNKGWRATKDNCYCPTCAKKKLKQ